MDALIEHYDSVAMVDESIASLESKSIEDLHSCMPCFTMVACRKLPK
jgi:hypothetical protein